MQHNARPPRTTRPRRWRVSPTLARDDVWSGDQPIVAGVEDARAVLIELNLSTDAEPRRVLDRLRDAFRRQLGLPEPERLSTRYDTRMALSKTAASGGNTKPRSNSMRTSRP